MLKIVRKFQELDIKSLLDIYAESCLESGRNKHAHLSKDAQLLCGQDDMLDYLRYEFFVPGAFCALWVLQGISVSALRVEPYRDGMLITALETAPEARGKGYAKRLVSQLLNYLQGMGIGKVYSHIDKFNKASLAVHYSCGFQKILEHAVYLDGSVSRRAYTLLYECDENPAG